MKNLRLEKNQLNVLKMENLVKNRINCFKTLKIELIKDYNIIKQQVLMILINKAHKERYI